MPDTKVRQNTFDIFPYDFVKENQVIANKLKTVMRLFHLIKYHLICIMRYISF